MINNLDELKGLVAAIASERQAQKDKEKRNAWTRFVSLSTILLAVLAAIATQKGAGFSSATMKQLNVATFNQAQASDQWSYYQAKGVKAAISAEEHDVLMAAGKADPKRLSDLEKKVERYGNEQKEIAVEAKKLEAKRDEANAAATLSARRGAELGTATSLFQLAIAFGGITLIMKKRWLWSASLLAGAIATAQMVRVLWMT